MSELKSLPVIQSLKTGIDMIELFVVQNRPLKFTEIQELTGMTKSNLHKYLNTLLVTGLLYRDAEGTYFLGSKLIEFGNAAIGNEDLIGRTAPYLKEISNHTKLTTLLSVWTHDGPVIANIWSINAGLNIGAQIGTRLPPLSSAGKMFTAFNQAPDVEEWKQKALKQFTPDEKESFEKEQATIREQYFAYAKDPLVEHVSSFSVPIFNFRQDIIGVVTSVGFTTSIPNSPDDEISSFVLKKVFELSKSFGWQGH